MKIWGNYKKLEWEEMLGCCLSEWLWLCWTGKWAGCGLWMDLCLCDSDWDVSSSGDSITLKNTLNNPRSSYQVSSLLNTRTQGSPLLSSLSSSIQKSSSSSSSHILNLSSSPNSSHLNPHSLMKDRETLISPLSLFHFQRILTLSPHSKARIRYLSFSLPPLSTF